MGCCGNQPRVGVYFRYLGNSTLTISMNRRVYTWTDVNPLAPVDPLDVPFISPIPLLQEEGIAHMEESY